MLYNGEERTVYFDELPKQELSWRDLKRDDKARTDNAFLHAYLTFQNLYEELDGENCLHQEEE